jgi:hypothetical protein
MHRDAGLNDMIPCISINFSQFAEQLLKEQETMYEELEYITELYVHGPALHPLSG